MSGVHWSRREVTRGARTTAIVGDCHFILPALGLIAGCLLLAPKWSLNSGWLQLGALAFLAVWTVGAFCAGRARMLTLENPTAVIIFGSFATVGYLGQLIALLLAETTIRGEFGWRFEPLGAFLVLGGGALRIGAIAVNREFFSGWQTEVKIAQVCRSGPYRLLRHPGYIGASLMLAGAVILHPSYYSTIFALSGLIGYSGLAAVEGRL